MDRVYGIDLGTTYSCIAYVDDISGRPVVIANRSGDLTTPSVVLFETDSNIVVGKAAKNLAVASPDHVVEMVKRHMGEESWRFFCDGKDYPPEEISSYILRKVVEDASQLLGEPVKDVVITCPAYFGIAQREATATAGKIAGLNVLEVINEPTAAAIAFGLQDESDQTVLVYDLGGGTFDITVIEIKGGSVTVKATGGDHLLGGRNWDEEIVKYLAEEWKRETGSSEDPLESPESLQELWQRAEEAKKDLSDRQKTSVRVNHNGRLATVELTRQKFDELTQPWLERTIQFTRETVDAAKSRGVARIDLLLLVGGSTKMPQVTERLQRELGMTPKVHDPDQSVAKGAAVYGQKLAIGAKIRTAIADALGTTAENVDLANVDAGVERRAEAQVAQDMGMRPEVLGKLHNMTVTNVASHSFGIVAIEPATRREYISNLVKVNDPLPRTISRTYGTFEANQDSVELQVLENNSTEDRILDLSLGEQVGTETLALPPGLPAGAPIEVTLELNQEGRLVVVGRDLTGGKKIEGVIQTSRGLTNDEMAEAVTRSRAVQLV